MGSIGKTYRRDRKPIGHDKMAYRQLSAGYRILKATLSAYRQPPKGCRLAGSLKI